MAKATGRDQLTQREREVVDALSRPLREEGRGARPASNRQIAAEVFLSLDAVKGHLRTIYAKLGLDTLRQNEKRAALAALGLRGELDPPRPKAARPGRRAVLAPVLAGMTLGLLGALALGGVVSAPTGGEDAPPAPSATAPGGGSTPKSGGGRAPRADAPALIEEPAGGLLPSDFVTETVSAVPVASVERIDAPEPEVGDPGKGRRHRKQVAKRAKPVPTPTPTPSSSAPVQQPAAAPAPRCVNHVHRIVHRKVVHRWVRRRVRVRVAHRHVRIEQVAFLHPHKRVWVDRKGRRHVRRWMHRHVRTVRKPYIHWHVRWKRKRVKVRSVVRQVEVRNHPHCG